jgi:hypothetical protein
MEFDDIWVLESILKVSRMRERRKEGTEDGKRQIMTDQR